MTSDDEILSQDEARGLHFGGPSVGWAFATPLYQSEKSIQWELRDGRKVWLSKKGHVWIEHPKHKGHFVVAWDDWYAKKEDLPRCHAYKPGPPAEMPPRYNPSIHRGKEGTHLPAARPS